jgi:recombination associated protein RdgC
MFRNVTMFRFPLSLDLSSLDVSLPWLRPVGPLELSSRGFVSPFGRDSEELTHRIDGCIWVTVGGEDKILPGSVVNDVLAKRLAEVERNEGRKPGGRARKRMKEDIVHELLPRALVKPSRVDAYLDTTLGVLFVDTASRKQAESVVGELRHALGSFPALPLNAEVAPRSVLTGWVAGEPLPEGLCVGDEAILKDPADRGARIAATRQEMASDEIVGILESGKQCTRLGLTLDDHASFTLDEDLALRKFKLLDGAIDALESTEREDIRAELDARFALLLGELRRLFAVLEPALSLSRVEG